MLDPMAVFALLFGIELFEDYKGHTAVASMASSELTGENKDPDKLHENLKVSGTEHISTTVAVPHSFTLKKIHLGCSKRRRRKTSKILERVSLSVCPW